MKVYEVWKDYGNESVSMHITKEGAERALQEKCTYNHKNQCSVGYTEIPHRWPNGNNGYCGITQWELKD